MASKSELLTRQGLLPTPPMAKGLPKAELTDNARQVLERRYVRRGPDGRPAETVEEMFWRVAYHVAKAEEAWSGDALRRATEFYGLLIKRKFLPNSPTFTGAGHAPRPAGGLLRPADHRRHGPRQRRHLPDPARRRLIQQTGGGNGFAFSRLSAARLAGEVLGRARRPAPSDSCESTIMPSARSPREARAAAPTWACCASTIRTSKSFITCKTDENQITNFNISVGITDAFMRAVRDDEDWELRFPDVHDPGYRQIRGTLEQMEQAGVPIETHRTVRARDLFDKIVKQAHHNGEPGVLFLDAANRSNPVPHLYPLEATNPCGEQWLGPYENCCLGSVNLNEHCGADGTVDWDSLRESVVTSTRFLDDVVEANAYVPAVPQLTEAAHRARRIGLGIMGLGRPDVPRGGGLRLRGGPGVCRTGHGVRPLPCHADQHRSWPRSVDRFPPLKARSTTWTTSRGLRPIRLQPTTRTGIGLRLTGTRSLEGLKRHGIRNAAQTTIAPTGTIATVAGCEGYGCEPVFALAYLRHVNDHGKDLQLTYASPRFDARAARSSDWARRRRQEIVDRVMREGTCQAVTEIPAAVRDVFVVSGDITAEEHVRMQAALQAFVDNSLSKTVNFPETATEEDVARAYMLAWELGCKGITVYVTGSREKVVLETKATAEKKQCRPTGPQAGSFAPIASWADGKKPRPERPARRDLQHRDAGRQGLHHDQRERRTAAIRGVHQHGQGRLGDGRRLRGHRAPDLVHSPTFVTHTSDRAPARGDAAAASESEAVGHLGFGPKRVRSLPDGIGQVLDQYLRRKDGLVNDGVADTPG